MAVLYVITAGAIWILFRLVSNIIDRVKLKEFDRQLGYQFGLAKGVLYCVVITFFAVTLSESARQVVLRSRSGDLIARAFATRIRFAEDVRKYLGDYIDELDKGLHTPRRIPLRAGHCFLRQMGRTRTLHPPKRMFRKRRLARRAATAPAEGGGRSASSENCC